MTIVITIIVIIIIIINCIYTAHLLAEAIDMPTLNRKSLTTNWGVKYLYKKRERLKRWSLTSTGLFYTLLYRTLVVHMHDCIFMIYSCIENILISCSFISMVYKWADTTQKLKVSMEVCHNIPLVLREETHLYVCRAIRLCPQQKTVDFHSNGPIKSSLYVSMRYCHHVTRSWRRTPAPWRPGTQTRATRSSSCCLSRRMVRWLLKSRGGRCSLKPWPGSTWVTWPSLPLWTSQVLL